MEIEEFILNISHEKRIELIIDCLRKDSYYSNGKEGGLREIAEYSKNCFDSLLCFSKYNSIQSSFGDKVYFEPDQRNLERETINEAFIKYGVHFITGTSQKTGFRAFDKSKHRNFDFILKTITDSELKLYIINSKNEETVNFIIKTKDKYNSIVVGRIEQIIDGIENIRITAFLPDQRDTTIKNKIASANVQRLMKTTRGI
jgi:hypothetical protein